MIEVIFGAVLAVLGFIFLSTRKRNKKADALGDRIDEFRERVETETRERDERIDGALADLEEIDESLEDNQARDLSIEDAITALRARYGWDDDGGAQ